ncbi:ATP-binding protein [Anaerolineales bacterium HSG24]|nr:ATP-binding protein [Anaerolineales bacterium HSG24]
MSIYITIFIIIGLLIVLAVQNVKHRRTQEELTESRREISYLEPELVAKKQELSEVRTRRKRLLAASTEALIIVEEGYRISSANKVARRLFGGISEDISFIQWTQQHELQELVEEVFKGVKMPSLYLTVNDNILVARARSIKNKKTKAVFAVALAIHDVTEIHRLTRVTRDFVTNISHELRTPITSISLLTETLLNGALDDPDVRYELVTKIADQTDSLSQLAQEVLDLSLIESGRAPLRLANCPLKQLVQSQIEQLLPQINRKRLKITIEVSDQLQVLIDQSMIERVVSNLLHNAMKFTKEGQIAVSASPLTAKTAKKIGESDAEYWVLVKVTDTGIGILPDNIERLFERFYTADRARSNNRSGTGLGLAIAKHIVEGHGGQIWAQSDGISGSQFLFTLPAET